MRSWRFILPTLGAAVCILSASWIVIEAGTPATRVDFDPTRPAPPMKLESIDGRMLSSTDLAGKVVLLEVWATWCRKCFSEIPVLNRLRNEYRPADLEIVGVAIRSDPAATALVEETLGMRYPVAMSSISFEEDFGPVWALPMTLLLDRKWRVRKSWIGGGAGKEDEIRTLVGRLLAEPAG